MVARDVYFIVIHYNLQLNKYCFDYTMFNKYSGGQMRGGMADDHEYDSTELTETHRGRVLVKSYQDLGTLQASSIPTGGTPP